MPRRGKLFVGIASLAILPCLLPAAATAATEFGGTCLGNAGAPGATLVQLTKEPGSPLPLAAPASGVITTWKLNTAPPPMPVPTRLKLLRPTADPRKFQTVAESGLETMVAGLNSFPTRIPIEAGDHLGLFSPTKEPAGTVYCKGGGPGDTIGAILGEAAVGSLAAVVDPGVEYQLPVAAVVEPDADRDGFGDETQDKCPQRASVQAACPPLVLDALGQAGRSFVSVLVAADLQAPVAVSGTVSFRRASKKTRATATLSAPSQTVSPGAIAAFKLSFPRALKAALAKLPRRRSLTLTATASGQNAAGVVATDSVTIKLRGRG